MSFFDEPEETRTASRTAPRRRRPTGGGRRPRPGTQQAILVRRIVLAVDRGGRDHPDRGAGQQLRGQRPQQRAQGLQQQRRVAQRSIGQHREELLRGALGRDQRPHRPSEQHQQRPGRRHQSAQQGQAHQRPRRGQDRASELRERAADARRRDPEHRPGRSSPRCKPRPARTRSTRSRQTWRVSTPRMCSTSTTRCRRSSARCAPPASRWAAWAASRSTRASSCPRSTGLNPTDVARALRVQLPAAQKKPVTPGLHGHELNSVSVGGTTLQTGSTNSIPASPAPTFTLNFANTGQNTETNVTCKVPGNRRSEGHRPDHRAPDDRRPVNQLPGDAEQHPAQGHPAGDRDDRPRARREDDDEQQPAVPGHVPMM